LEAVQTWLQAGGIAEGLLFRAIWRGGRLKPQGLRGIDVARAVKYYAALAGFDATKMSGHFTQGRICNERRRERSQHLQDRRPNET
jgi:hypothetical protein